MKLFLALAFLFTAALHAHNGSADNHYHSITTEELRDLIYSGQDFTLVDARTKEYDDGTRLPNAIHVPHNLSQVEIQAALPEKDETIVVYCTSKKCPASRKLADKLVGWGYTEIWKYDDGLEGWIDAGGKTIR